MEGNKHVVNVFKSKWKHGDVVSIKVSGIKERKISISYYFNNKLMQEINNVLEGVDVINIKENRLYFDADIFQHDNNIDNTVAIVSFTKPTKEQLEETLQQCKKP